MSLIYFLLWLIFNGRFTTEIIIAGALFSFLLDLFVRKLLRLNLTFSNLVKTLRLLPDIFLYLIVLVIEIVRANFSIFKLVLAPQIDVEPCLVKFNTKLKTNAARVAFANSITLTPGTITVSLEGSELLVHALNREIAGGLKGSIFERLLARMERILNA
ncbi:MAG: Na+/H+ antiporter subunit E [Synergistaceae bacterium]|nr:Na+/H+ antiporter subunit E [Synergistaceae bacterium]